MEKVVQKAVHLRASDDPPSTEPLEARVVTHSCQSILWRWEGSEEWPDSLLFQLLYITDRRALFKFLHISYHDIFGFYAFVFSGVLEMHIFFIYSTKMEIAILFFASSKREGKPPAAQYCEWDELFAWGK